MALVVTGNETSAAARMPRRRSSWSIVLIAAVAASYAPARRAPSPSIRCAPSAPIRLPLLRRSRRPASSACRLISRLGRPAARHDGVEKGSLSAFICGQLFFTVSSRRLRAAPQRTDSGDPLDFKEQRRTGAGSFVRSTAKEDNFAVARNVLAWRAVFPAARLRAPGMGLSSSSGPAAKVHDIEVFAGVQRSRSSSGVMRAILNS